MIRTILCSYLILICSAQLAWAQGETTEVLNAGSETQVKGLDLPVGESLQSKKEKSDDVASMLIKTVEKAIPQANSSAERAARPISSWMENKLQNNSLLKPSTHSREVYKQPHGERTLREAILLARAQFSGSVLSAKRLSENDKNIFSIKILSEAGVLRQINIDAAIELPVTANENTQGSQ